MNAPNKKEKGVVSVSTDVIFDRTLSLDAKGLYCILCDAAKHEYITAEDLYKKAETYGVTKAEMLPLIKELAEHGYVEILNS